MLGLVNNSSVLPFIQAGMAKWNLGHKNFPYFIHPFHDFYRMGAYLLLVTFGQEAVENLILDRHAQFLGWTPLTHPPTPPSGAPTQTKSVPICSFFKQASICILIKTWNWRVAQLWAKNWDTDAHAHMTYQAIIGLHSPIPGHTRP